MTCSVCPRTDKNHVGFVPTPNVYAIKKKSTATFGQEIKSRRIMCLPFYWTDDLRRIMESFYWRPFWFICHERGRSFWNIDEHSKTMLLFIRYLTALIRGCNKGWFATDATGTVLKKTHKKLYGKSALRCYANPKSSLQIFAATMSLSNTHCWQNKRQLDILSEI